MTNLLLHCGGTTITRDELADAATPERTRSWVPIAHERMLSLVEDNIESTGFCITNQAHALHKNGDRYFGLMELSNGCESPDYSLVLGLRNSHDKSFPASLALGNQVIVCDNLSFYGEVVLTRRHTTFIERDLPGIVATATGRLGSMRQQQDERIETYKATQLTQRTVHDLAVRAVDARVIPVTQLPAVLGEWRRPSHQEFANDGPSAWRLFNAFTEIFKGRNMATLPRRSQALHGLLDGVCEMTMPRTISV